MIAPARREQRVEPGRNIVLRDPCGILNREGVLSGRRPSTRRVARAPAARRRCTWRNSRMGGRLGANQLLLHIGLPDEPLDCQPAWEYCKPIHSEALLDEVERERLHVVLQLLAKAVGGAVEPTEGPGRGGPTFPTTPARRCFSPASLPELRERSSGVCAGATCSRRHCTWPDSIPTA